jgi:hypothetical protein
MKYLAIIILVMFFFSCKKTNTTTEESKVQNTTIAVNTCHSFSTNSNFSICYDSLLTESRCPSDVVCFWQGVAVVKLTFTQNNSNVLFKLSTLGSLGSHYFPPKDTTINGVNIKLLDVQPYPKFIGSNNEIKKVILSIK